jgi:hypothetical protein
VREKSFLAMSDIAVIDTGAESSGR